MIDAVSLAALDSVALPLLLINVDAVDVAVAVPDGLHEDSDVTVTVLLDGAAVDASAVSDGDCVADSDAVSLTALDSVALPLPMIVIDVVYAAVAVAEPDGLHEDVTVTVLLNDVVIDASAVSDGD